MVHPTDARGLLTRKGAVKRESEGGCLTLTGESGELYFLTGETDALRAGSDARVEGRPVQSSRCGVGTTIEVQSASRVAER